VEIKWVEGHAKIEEGCIEEEIELHCQSPFTPYKVHLSLKSLRNFLEYMEFFSCPQCLI
jgi:hypothetical protein